MVKLEDLLNDNVKDVERIVKEQKETIKELERLNNMFKRVMGNKK